MVRGLAKRIASAAVSRGRVEYVHDVAAPLTASVLGAMFGLDDATVLELRPALDDFFTRDIAVEAAGAPHVKAMAVLRAALDGLVEDRGQAPGGDLISAMIATEEEGARLSHEQVVVTTMTFLTAGFESVNNLLTNTANALCRVPGLFAALRADASLVPQFVEEGMRWDRRPHKDSYDRQWRTWSFTIRRSRPALRCWCTSARPIVTNGNSTIPTASISTG